MGRFQIDGVWYDAGSYSEARTMAQAAKATKPAVAPVVAGPAPLPAAVLALQGIGTPVVAMTNRGGTAAQRHLGLGEEVNLTLNGPVPPGYKVKWTLMGDADLKNETANSALLVAGPTPGFVTATLKVSGGPHNGRALHSLEFRVVAPSGTLTRQSPDENLLRHTTGMAGIGFKMWVNLLPDNVCFSKLQWREHTGLGIGTGHFESENGRIHAPSGVAYNAQKQPTSQLSSTWMNVDGPDGPPYNNNWVGQVDKVDTGDHPPHVPAAGATPARWRASSHHWHIEWKYRVMRANGMYSGEYVLERSMHEAKIAEDGTATIKKGDAGPFTRAASDPTSDYS